MTMMVVALDITVIWDYLSIYQIVSLYLLKLSRIAKPALVISHSYAEEERLIPLV